MLAKGKFDAFDLEKIMVLTTGLIIIGVLSNELS